MRPLAALLLFAAPVLAANDSKNPTWWDKYQYLLNNGPDALATTAATSSGSNVDVSNECGPQSETYIAINPSRPRQLAAGSNEIFRDPMRGYFSTDNGASWGGVDLPLPAPIGNGTRFGSDPTLAFDSSGRVYYGYIVVFFGNGNGVNGTEMAVARSLDGGKTYPQVTYFDFQGGSNHFNDKPMITADANANSPFRDNVYLAWDAAIGGSTGGGIRVARSTDNGKTFTSVRADDQSGPGRSIGATVTTGPDGQVYVAWNDYAANAIVFNSSLDGGASFGTPRVIATKTIPFDIRIPAESFRGALVYPACDADRSSGANRGRINCSWMDLNAAGNTDIYAVDLLTYILGDGPSSRLNQVLREQRGLVQTIDASYIPRQLSGLVSVTARLDAKNFDAAEAAVREIVRRVRDEGVTSAERERAITTAESSYAFDIETVEGLAKAYGQAETTWTLDNELAYLGRLRQVTAAQIQAAARKYLGDNDIARVRFVPKATR